MFGTREISLSLSLRLVDVESDAMQRSKPVLINRDMQIKTKDSTRTQVISNTKATMQQR